MIQLADSFDGYASVAQKYGRVLGSPSITNVGRNGTNGLQISGSQGIYIQLEGHPETITFGFALRPLNGAGPRTLFSIWDDSYALAYEQFRATLLPDGSLRFDRGDAAGGAFLLAVSTYQLRFDAYQYVEFQFTAGVSVLGSCLWHVDGGPAFDLTALTTSSSGNAWASRLVLGGSGTGTLNIDDLYVLDDQGDLTDFLGDIRVQTRRPNGAGYATNWEIGGAIPQPTNWESVDEANADELTSLVRMGTPGVVDSYTFEDLTTPAGLVLATVLQPRVRKTNAGLKKLQGTAHHGGADGVCDTPAVVSSDWAYLGQPIQLNPSTGSPFTIEEWNAAEFGVQVET